MHTFVGIVIMVVRPPFEVRIRHLHISHNAPNLPPEIVIHSDKFVIKV